jgi:hypothetical protein
LSFQYHKESMTSDSTGTDWIKWCHKQLCNNKVNSINEIDKLQRHKLPKFVQEEADGPRCFIWQGSWISSWKSLRDNSRPTRLY